MSHEPIPSRSRREFLRATARYASLGAFTAMAVVVSPWRRRTVGEPSCVTRGLCQNCVVLDQCGLPAALLAKGTLKGG